MENDFFEKYSSKILWVILILAVAVRLYYFFLTRNQALWWDEAEYLVVSKIWAGLIPDVGWFGGRPLLLPFIGFIFYKIGLNGELTIRLVELLLSIIGVYLTYAIGKTLYSKKIGLIASFIGSFFYLDLFFSNKIMVDIPSSVLGFLGFYLILKGYIYGKNNPYLILGSIALMSSVLMKYTGVLFIIGTGITALLIKGRELFKDKRTWIAAGFGILTFIPFLIYGLLNQRILKGIFEAGSSAASLPLNEKISLFFTYVTFMPVYLKITFLILFLIGLITMLNIFLGFDLIIKGENKKLQHDFIILIFIILPLIYFGFFVNHFEDRYIVYSFTPIFIVAAIGLVKLEEYIKKYVESAAKYTFLILIVILLFGSYQQLVYADSLIKSKMTAFQPQRPAGEWLKENTEKGDIIFASEDPQFTYYAEIDVLGFPKTVEEFHEKVKETNAKFMVVSVYERPPQWIYTYAQEYPDNVEGRVVFAIGDQPAIVIYEIKKEKTA